jgi:hypothetical protein
MYCPVKTNRACKLYRSRGLPFPLNRWYFIFKIKGNLLLNRKKRFQRLNPLRPSGKSCSDLAEIFSMAFFNFLKNILFFILIFYLALLKSYYKYCIFIFWKFITVQCSKKKFYTSVLGFSLVSQELITVEIIWISLILTEIWSEMWRKSRKKRENALLEKKFKVVFSTFFLLKFSYSNPL